ncbi:hypothetical protein GCM10010911_06010 [Paenibacillus nasutitermitis]|uniref:peptidylprolyl isomerase n=2 Tax=Paenibacillus nasutitermitis TaxID=1652958 RepID=A0A916YLK1_9BACL|nr:hypothetical protein GCM10010911_06010 [Paenibacillus nasutitermitis]
MVGIGAVILLGAVFFVRDRFAEQKGDYGIAATVDGESVSVGELKHQLLLARSETVMYFLHTYGAAEDDSFWTKRYGDEVPRQVLLRKALDRSVRVKVEQLEAKRKGLVDDISYAAFRSGLVQENERRQKAVEQQQAVYGPVQYTEDVYHEYVRSNMNLALKAALIQGDMPIGEDELRKHYETMRDELYKEEGRITIEKIRLGFFDGQGRISDTVKEEAGKRIEEVRQKLSRQMDFGELAEAYNETASERETRGRQVFDSASGRQDQLYDLQLKEAAMKLEPGQISGIIETASAYFIIKCIAKQSDAYKPYEEVRENVKLNLTNVKFEEWISRKMKDAVVETNSKVLDSMKIL